MAHGGTNFAFETGAGGGGAVYKAVTTSYDYDAPISEAGIDLHFFAFICKQIVLFTGDLTPKYFAMKEVIGRYLPIPSVPVQNASAKGDYGKVNLTFVGSIFDLRDFIAQERLSVKKNESKVNPRFILIASKFQQLVETQSCGTLKLEAR